MCTWFLGGRLPFFPVLTMAKVNGATLPSSCTLCWPSRSDHVVCITSSSLCRSGVGGTGQAGPTLLRSSPKDGGGGVEGDTNLCTEKAKFC